MALHQSNFFFTKLTSIPGVLILVLTSMQANGATERPLQKFLLCALLIEKNCRQQQLLVLFITTRYRLSLFVLLIIGKNIKMHTAQFVACYLLTPSLGNQKELLILIFFHKKFKFKKSLQKPLLIIKMIVFRCTPTTPYRKLLNIVFWVTYPGFVGPSSILLTSNEKAPLELFQY